MIHDGYILPCYHSDGFCKPTTRTPYTLTWFDEKFCLIFRLQGFIGRMTRIKDRYWIETDNFIESSNITNNLQTEGIQGTDYPTVKTPKSTKTIQAFHDLKYTQMRKLFAENQNHYIRHNMKKFLLHT